MRRSAARLEWPAFTSPCCGSCFEGCEMGEERVLWVGRRACFPPRVRAVVVVTFDGPIITASSRDGTHALRGNAILSVATSTPCDARRPSLSLRLSRDVGERRGTLLACPAKDRLATVFSSHSALGARLGCGLVRIRRSQCLRSHRKTFSPSPLHESCARASARSRKWFVGTPANFHPRLLREAARFEC